MTKHSRRLLRTAKLLPVKFRRHLAKPVTLALFIFSLLAIFVQLLPSPPSPAPVLAVTSSNKKQAYPVSSGQSLPQITAKNIFVMDRDTGVVLYHQQADDQVAPASTTKIATALVVLEHFPLTQEITVTRSYPNGQTLQFQPGEKLTVEQLLYALLVYSANDAAEIFAENFTGGRDAFISTLNSQAAVLGLYHTHFANPTGLDEAGHYSSASDLARLADAAMDNAEFARVVATENAVIASRVVTNVNELLVKVPGVLGIKTGYTDAAGQSLVTLVNQGHPVIVVILGSTDRFTDTEKLITWVYSNFTWN